MRAWANSDGTGTEALSNVPVKHRTMPLLAVPMTLQPILRYPLGHQRLVSPQPSLSVSYYANEPFIQQSCLPAPGRVPETGETLLVHTATLSSASIPPVFLPKTESQFDQVTGHNRSKPKVTNNSLLPSSCSSDWHVT